MPDLSDLAKHIETILVAIVTILVTVETLYTKWTHRDVKQLKNGELKAKVTEALDEHSKY